MASIATNKYKVVAVPDKCGIEKTQEREQRQRRHLSPKAFSLSDKKGTHAQHQGTQVCFVTGLICARYDPAQITSKLIKSLLIRVNPH